MTTAQKRTSPTLRSPSLTISPPPIVGSNFSREAMSRQEKMWETSSWPRKDITFNEVPDALVLPRGLVLNNAGDPVESTRFAIAEDIIEDAVKNHGMIREKAATLEGTHVLCARPGLTCYGHVVAEILPPAWLINRTSPQKASLLLGSIPGGIGDVYSSVLKLLGYTALDSVTRNNGPLVVESLTIVEGFAETGRYLSPLIKGFADELAASVPPGPPVGQRIFLPRKKGYGRGIENEEAAAKLLAADGFITVYPEDLSFEQQIGLFRGARTIVGTLGSALTNIMFSLPGARVLALAPEFAVDTFFWRIAGCVGHLYEEMRCSTVPNNVSEESSRLMDRDITVDLEALEDWLAIL